MATSRLAIRPSRQTHRRASWLGVFAMMMMFVGPLLSQSLPMDPGQGMSMPMSMDMPATMDLGEHHASHDQTLHPLWEKCGYCSLFFHIPALPQSPQFTAAAQPLRSTATVRQPRLGHGRRAVFPGALTRAPPAFSQA